ncbi:hypothetical protein GCM10027590_61800 [Nocardiopsis nanhaiensis]
METRADFGTVSNAVGQRWRRLPITAQDTLLAGVWMLAFLVMGVSGPWGWSLGAPWTTLMELLTCLPLVLRRRYPLKVALAVGALMMLTLGISTDVHPLTLALVAYAGGSAAFHGTPMSALVPLSTGWFLLFFHLVGHGDLSPEPADQLVMIAVMGALPAIIGYLLRLRAERTEQRLRATRARAQQERARERARIARDVHDIAGHHLSAIRLLAVGGRESLKRPDADPDAVLAGIADASGRAVREVRELLDLLRSDRLDEPAPADVRLDDIPPAGVRAGRERGRGGPGGAVRGEQRGTGQGGGGRLPDRAGVAGKRAAALLRTARGGAAGPAQRRVRRGSAAGGHGGGRRFGTARG